LDVSGSRLWISRVLSLRRRENRGKPSYSSVSYLFLNSRKVAAITSLPYKIMP
jgi:hypothetical protein